MQMRKTDSPALENFLAHVAALAERGEVKPFDKEMYVKYLTDYPAATMMVRHVALWPDLIGINKKFFEEVKLDKNTSHCIFQGDTVTINFRLNGHFTREQAETIRAFYTHYYPGTQINYQDDTYKESGLVIIEMDFNLWLEKIYPAMKNSSLPDVQVEQEETEVLEEKKEIEATEGLLALPIELQCMFLGWLDLLSKNALSQTRRSLRKIVLEDPKFISDKYYVINMRQSFWGKTFSQENLITFAARTLNTTYEGINTSEKFEEAVLKHILQLDPQCADGSLANAEVSGHASFLFHSSKNQIWIGYRKLSEEQVRAIATSYNSFYPGIKASFYPGGIGRQSGFLMNDEKKPGAILALNPEVFCNKVLPVINGVFNRPSERQAVEPAPSYQPVYRC